MDYPLISVIIPTHNKAHQIHSAIDAMLCQTYKNIEIIIIDDHSTDDTEQVVDKYVSQNKNIKYYKLPYDDPQRFSCYGTNINAGWQSRNYGVEKANGDYITFQDDDDGSCSNRLEFQYNMLLKYNSHHINVDWQQYQDKYNCKKLDMDISEKDIISTEEILNIAKKTGKGLFRMPIKRDWGKGIFGRLVRKVFYYIDWKHRNWSPYPCAASMPMLKKEVFDKCHFRQLYKRTRPSLKGRGVDRDFNFWVAETFKDSIAIKIPLILWRVENQNPEYIEKKYIPK